MREVCLSTFWLLETYLSHKFGAHSDHAGLITSLTKLGRNRYREEGPKILASIVGKETYPETIEVQEELQSLTDVMS